MEGRCSSLFQQDGMDVCLYLKIWCDIPYVLSPQIEDLGMVP